MSNSNIDLFVEKVWSKLSPESRKILSKPLFKIALLKAIEEDSDILKFINKEEFAEEIARELDIVQIFAKLKQ